MPPIFSGASSFLTRIFYLNILLTLKARDTPIVIGRPSGTDTTTRTTAMLMKLIILEMNVFQSTRVSSESVLVNTNASRDSLIIKITKIIAAETSAIRVNCCSRLCSLVCKGVSSLTPRASTSSVFLVDYSPTQQIRAFPYPLTIF